MMKRRIESREALQEFARDIAIQAGALAECDKHEDVLLHQQDDDAERQAYAIGTKWCQRHGMDRKELMAMIKSAIDSGAFDCPYCEREREE